MSNILLILGLLMFAAVTMTGAIMAQSDWQQYAASREMHDTDAASNSPVDMAEHGQGV